MKFKRITLILVLSFFLVSSTELFSQNSFRNIIEPILENNEFDYRFIDNRSCYTQLCDSENNCERIFIAYYNMDRSSEDIGFAFIEVYSPVLRLAENSQPSISLLRKISELNSNLSYGKLEMEKNVLYYVHTSWLNNLQEDHLVKDITAAFYLIISLKSELEAYKN